MASLGFRVQGSGVSGVEAGKAFGSASGRF